MERSLRASEESDAAKGNQGPTIPQPLMHKASDMPTNGDSESAIEKATVARAFAIPELLETVLVKVADEAVVACVKSLFVLQRVNSTFRDTINDSLALRQSMFKHDSSNDLGPVVTLNPLLFDNSVERILYPATLVAWDCAPREGLTTNKIRCILQAGLMIVDGTPRRDSTNAVASWRSLKLCRCCGLWNIYCWIRGTLLTDTQYDYHLLSVDGIASNSTLGEFADKFITGNV